MIFVYTVAPPLITSSPRASTVRRSGNAIFTCSVQAHPRPTIVWHHNGFTVTENQPDYLITQDTSTRDTRSSMMATSKLRILSTAVDNTGNVTCTASADAPQGSGITLVSDSQSASLTVLGK